MGIDDPYTAWCLDDACFYMTEQARAGKEPDFERPKRRGRKENKETTNSEAVAMLRALGVKT